MPRPSTRELLPNGISVLIASNTRSPDDRPGITLRKKRVLLTIFAPGYACRASDFDLVIRRSLDDDLQDSTGPEQAAEKVYVSVDFPGTGGTDVSVLERLDSEGGEPERIGDGKGRAVQEGGGDVTTAAVEERKKRGKPTIEGYARCLNYVRRIMYERLYGELDWDDSTGSEARGGDEGKTEGNRIIDTLLVGHSMGVRVVLDAFTQRPQGVIGLVFLDGSWYNLRGKGMSRSSLGYFGERRVRRSSKVAREDEERKRWQVKNESRRWKDCLQQCGRSILRSSFGSRLFGMRRAVLSGWRHCE